MTVSAIGQGMSMSMLYGMQKPSASDMASKILSDLDTDGDGALSTEEIGQSGEHAEAILGADADGDGVVTQDELVSDITKKMEDGTMPPPPPMDGTQPNADDMASNILDELDTDGDGALSTDEINAGGDRATRILQADTDGDGVVTKDELVADITKNMASNQAQMQQTSASDDETSSGGSSDEETDPADTNRDGVVSVAELIAYLTNSLASSQSQSQLSSLA